MAIMGGPIDVAQCIMDRIANMMVNQLNAPVSDTTGLTGKYDVNMFWEAWWILGWCTARCAGRHSARRFRASSDLPSSPRFKIKRGLKI
jgi:uncharacterized protein (TIGR03435 family)